MTPRCGRAVRRYEAVWGALPEDPACGRPAGHNGQHRSVMGVRRKQAADTARLTRRRRERRVRARQAARRAALAQALRGFDCDGWRHAA